MKNVRVIAVLATFVFVAPSVVLRADNVEDKIVANCIISLRMLATQDWQVFFEDVSRVEHILRDDPANVYARMDRETRDRYRKVVEQLAFATGKDEQHVAREAIGLAQANVSATPRATHVGYYLLDSGRALLEARLGYRVPVGARVRCWIFTAWRRGWWRTRQPFEHLHRCCSRAPIG